MMFGFIRKAFRRLTGREEEREAHEELSESAQPSDQPTPIPPAESPPLSKGEKSESEEVIPSSPEENVQAESESPPHLPAAGDAAAREESLPPASQKGRTHEIEEDTNPLEEPLPTRREAVSSQPVIPHGEAREEETLPPRKTRDDTLQGEGSEESMLIPPGGEPSPQPSPSSSASPPPPSSTPLSSSPTPPPQTILPEEDEQISASHTRAEEESSSQEETLGEEKATLFGRLMQAVTTRTLSEEAFERLYEPMAYALLEANVAFEIVERLRDALKERLVGKRLSRRHARIEIEHALREVVEESLHEPDEDLITLARKAKEAGRPFIILFLGPNGAGKTTTIAKLAYQFKQQGLRPVIAAADTFRAAALEQLGEHAERLGVRLVKHAYGADPAAVAFDARRHAEAGHADVVLIDTAGRLQTNENLLREVEKVKRVVKPDLTLLVVESTAGSDAVEQARVFDERIGIDGFILTKTDADQLGGTLLSVSALMGKPIFLLGTGQEYEDLIPFRKDELIRLLLGEE